MRKSPLLHFLLFLGYFLNAQNIEDKEIFQNTILSYHATNLTTEEDVLSFQNRVNVTPASTQKLITTATALKVLGPDFIFESSIGITGKIVDGALIGDLVLIPNSNPALCNDRFQNNFESLKVIILNYLESLSISSIQGSVVIVDSLRQKETLPRKWLWEDIGNYFGANPSSTMLNENRLSVFFESGAIGTQTKIVGTAPSIDLSLKNYVTAHSGSSDQAYAFSRPLDEVITIHGSIPANRKRFEVITALPDPTVYLGNWICKNVLKGQGPSMSIVESAPKGIRSKQSGIHKVDLKSVVKEINLHSVNILAEIVYQNLEKVSAIFPKAFHLEDGSGLSKFNLIQTKALVELLAKNSNNEEFLNSLSVAGKSGTLKYYFNTSALAKNLTGKSGYMQGVRSYAGYVKNKRGETIAFAIVVNNFTEYNSEIKKAMREWLEELTRI